MKFIKQTQLQVPAQFLFDWHKRPGALDRLMPPWENVKVLQAADGIQDGKRVILSVPLGPIRKKWIAEHCGYEEGRKFEDVQLSGPFASYHHKHICEPITETSCFLRDEIEYELPLGGLGKTFGASHVEQKLETMFRYRHEQTRVEVEQHYRYARDQKWKVLISGSSGLVGSSLTTFLQTGGHEVFCLVRDERQALENPKAIFWDIKKGEIERQKLEGFDAVVHLAGANIAGHRWTPEYKETIKNSRVKSTQLLASLLATLHHKPRVLISTSAVGYYGDRKAEVLTEHATSGVGFLPEVAREWEREAAPAAKAGIRVVHPRIGIILSPHGGALEKMLTPFRWGVGGVIGSGKQYWSAISLPDVISGLYFLMHETSLSGPVNFTMPEETTNREFIKTLGRVLKRPTLAPVPAMAIKMMMGEMGKALLLDSTRVRPEKLLQAGYPFQHPTLEEALRHQLGQFTNSAS